MAVFRVEKTRNYTVMSNYHLRDKSLSLKAKGLLSLMLSLPEDWDYTTRGLAYICKDGVDSICATVRELEGAGYIVRARERHADGKAHLHNHVVVNSVSFVDGKKYHSSPGSYYFEVRSTSDTLCRENDLSVIAPQGKGKHYAEWKAENTGKPTIRSIIRGDIDRFIGEAYTYETFLMLLRREGYVVQNRPDRKYVTVLPPGGKRAIRLDSLGDGYTEQDIRRRLAV